MSRPRMSQDQAFWRIVQDLSWKLDDGRSGPPPAAEPEFTHGGRPPRTVPTWTTHVIAFVLGALCWALALVAPTLLATAAAWAVGCVGVVIFLRRRR